MTEVKEMLLKTLSTYSFWPWKFMPKYENQWITLLYNIIRKDNSEIIFFIYQWIYEKSIQQYGVLSKSMHFPQDNHLHFTAIYLTNPFLKLYISLFTKTFLVILFFIFPSKTKQHIVYKKIKRCILRDFLLS